MAKKKAIDDLDTMRKVALGGALAVKSTGLISHARNPTALTGDIGGILGIGIAGATSDIAMDLITGKPKWRKKKKKRFDRTGPEGKGPKTGRGLGIC